MCISSFPSPICILHVPPILSSFICSRVLNSLRQKHWRCNSVKYQSRLPTTHDSFRCRPTDEQGYQHFIFNCCTVMSWRQAWAPTERRLEWVSKAWTLIFKFVGFHRPRLIGLVCSPSSGYPVVSPSFKFPVIHIHKHTYPAQCYHYTGPSKCLATNPIVVEDSVHQYAHSSSSTYAARNRRRSF